MVKNLLSSLFLLVWIVSVTGCMQPGVESDPTVVYKEKQAELPAARSGASISIASVNTKAVLNRNVYSAAASPNSEGGSVVVTALPSNIVKVSITITGSNIDTPIVYDLVKVNDNWQGIIGNIPAGEATVTSRAYDNTDTLLYESVANITVVNHQTLSLNLTLEPVDPPPGYNVKAPRITLVSVSPIKVAPGDPVSLAVSAYDPDPAGPLTYLWSPLDIGVFDNPNTPNPTWTAPAEEGTYRLTITVIDNEYLLDHFDVFIEVDEKYGDGNVDIVVGTNDFPIIHNITANPTRIDKGESTDISVSATDPDGNTLSFSWTSSFAGVFSDAAAANPTFTVDSGVDYGLCTLTVNVSDGSLITTGSIVINISDNPALNTAPVIKSAFQSDDEVSAGGTLTFIVRSQDPEGGNLTFNWSSTAGTFGTQTDTSNAPDHQSEIIWTAPATSTGPITISVEISDPEGLVTVKEFIPVTLH